VSEIRSSYSNVLFMPQYREPLALRILETAWDIQRPYPEYPGRERRTDRVFYRGEDGIDRPLTVLRKDHIPWVVRPVTGLVQLCARRGVRPSLHLLLAGRPELLP